MDNNMAELKVEDEEMLKMLNSIVYTTRLDQMHIFSQVRSIKDTDVVFDAIIKESKPNINRKRVRSNSDDTSERISAYEDLSLRINFVNKKARVNQHNKNLLRLCKPVTVVVEKLKICPNKDIRETTKYLNLIPFFRMNARRIINILCDQQNNEIDIYFLDSLLFMKEYVRLQNVESYKSVLKELAKSHANIFLRYFCCWYARKEWFDEYVRTHRRLRSPDSLNFMRKPHKCSINNCLCCCSTELVLSNENYTINKINLSEKPRDWYNKMKQRTDLRNTPIVKSFNDNNLSLKISNNNNCNMNNELLPSNSEKLREICAKQPPPNFSKKFCCWYKQEKSYLASRSLADCGVINFMRRPHLCSIMNCKCCCKPEKTQKSKFTYFDIPLRYTNNFTEYREIKISKDQTKPVNASRPRSVDKIRPEPVDTNMPNPIDSSRHNPIDASRPNSIDASRPNPIDANRPNPIDASRPNPIDASRPNPIDASRPNPININSPNPIGARISNSVVVSGPNIVNDSSIFPTNIVVINRPNVLNANRPNIVNVNRPTILNVNRLNIVNANISNIVNANRPNIVNANSPNIVNVNRPTILNVNRSNIVNVNRPNSVNATRPNILNVNTPNILKVNRPNSVNATRPNIDNANRRNSVNATRPNIDNANRSNSVNATRPNIVNVNSPNNLNVNRPNSVNANNPKHETNSKKMHDVGLITFSISLSVFEYLLYNKKDATLEEILNLVIKKGRPGKQYKTEKFATFIINTSHSPYGVAIESIDMNSLTTKELLILDMIFNAIENFSKLSSAKLEAQTSKLSCTKVTQTPGTHSENKDSLSINEEISATAYLRNCEFSISLKDHLQNIGLPKNQLLDFCLN